MRKKSRSDTAEAIARRMAQRYAYGQSPPPPMPPLHPYPHPASMPTLFSQFQPAPASLPILLQPAELHAWEAVQARVVAHAGERAVARAEALARALAGAWALAEPRETFTFRYDEILADSELKHIIYSIKPYHRQRLARELSHRSYTLQEYRWFIQIVKPITRLPPELLHQILLILIDDTSYSPSVLMRVCKLWYTITTGIWAPLKLGTTTPTGLVTNKYVGKKSMVFGRIS